MSRRGLPETIKMRHDAHYVESLTTDQFKTFGRYISVTDIDPNPEQPRVDVGDLDELMASIADKGVLEPLLVRQTPGSKRWMIIAGERRWRAACAAGLEQVPCIEMSVDDKTVAEIALIENIQRKDLTIWEEADAMQSLIGKFGYTHHDIAKKLGKSRSTITETLSLTSIPTDIRRECQLLDISSKALLLQIVRQPTDEYMRVAVAEFRRKNSEKTVQSKSQKALGNVKKDSEVDAPSAQSGLLGKPAKYTFANGEYGFVLQLKFDKAEVELEEVATALNVILENLNGGRLVQGWNS